MEANPSYSTGNWRPSKAPGVARSSAAMLSWDPTADSCPQLRSPEPLFQRLACPTGKYPTCHPGRLQVTQPSAPVSEPGRPVTWDRPGV